MANEKREKAQRMASRGASVQQIKEKTGLSGQAARVVSNNYNPALTSTPQAPPSSSSSGSSSGSGNGNGGQRSTNQKIQAKLKNAGGTVSYNEAAKIAQTLGISVDRVYNQTQKTGQKAKLGSGAAAAGYDGSGSKANFNTGSGSGGTSGISRKKSLTKNLRIAKADGISKKELEELAKKVGYGKVVKRIDAMNKNGQDVRLNSGAANRIYRDMTEEQSNPYDTYNYRQSFGTGRTARTILDMVGDPGSPGVMIKGQLVGGREATAGTGLMIGGTQIRPGGRPVVSGFGGNNQNENPDGDPGPGSITVGGSWDPSTRTPGEEALPEDTISGPGMMSGGGLGVLGANKLNRAKSRLRKLGIYGRGTDLLGRGLQYGNALNK